MPKKRVYVEKYYSHPEDEMQELLLKAKNGDKLAQEELLNTFSNFLQKYETLLYHGRYTLHDYDVRCFVSLFIKDKMVRSAVKRNKVSNDTIKSVNEVMRGIFYMIQRYADPEDVEQTVRMSFFHCVSIYERKEKIPFSGFLYSYYYYVLKKQVDALLINQLGRKTFALISDETALEESGSDEQPTQGFTAPPTLGADEFIFSEEIDEDWVSGKTAYGAFAILTVQERQLLKWRYIDGIRSNDIADKITEHPNTVREHYHRIRGRISEYLLNERESLQND